MPCDTLKVPNNCIILFYLKGSIKVKCSFPLLKLHQAFFISISCYRWLFTLDFWTSMPLYVFISLNSNSYGWANHFYYLIPFQILQPLLWFLKDMNSTDDSAAAAAAAAGGGGGFLGSNNISGFGYGIGVSIGILLLITTITLASYFCTRTTQQTSVPNQRRNRSEDSLELPDVVVHVGLDEATLKSYPKLLYSEAKLHKTDSTAACCSICLADYKNTDMLRLLPECGHLFHLKCVDPWLRLHPTCPVCRTSPLPTPLSTPLAEVVPLASRSWQNYHISM